MRSALRWRTISTGHRRVTFRANDRQRREQGDARALEALPHPCRPCVGRRHRRRRDYPRHRLLSHEGRELRKVRPAGGLRVRWRNPAGYRRAAKASRRGKENRERRAQRGIRNRRRHRRGHARLSDRAQAEARRPLGRHARENGNRPAQALPARLMGADQPSMGALRA